MDLNSRRNDCKKRVLPRRYYTMGQYDVTRRPFIEYLRMWGKGNVFVTMGNSPTKTLSERFTRPCHESFENTCNLPHMKD